MKKKQHWLFKARLPRGSRNFLESLKSSQNRKTGNRHDGNSSGVHEQQFARIKSYRGAIDLNFSAPAAVAGDFIGKAFEAGANQLRQVTLRPSDAALEAARLDALKNACSNALLTAETALAALAIEKKEIMNVTIQPSKHPSPIFRNAQPVMMAMKESPSTKILEGEQTVHSQIDLSIKFKEK